MSKELIVSVNGREKKIAIVEDDLVTEFYVERGDENQGIVGNIYKGRVMKVLPGMQSAFVDIGLERDSFLYVSDFLDEEELDEDEVAERKEAARPAPRAERARPQREIVLPARFTTPEVADADEENEEDLHEALRHIQEISTEPVIEPAPDDETDEAADSAPAPEAEAKEERGRYSSRQRRQSRLRYSESPKEEPVAETTEPAEESAEIVEATEEPVEAEESGASRRRRRRPRRGETAKVATALTETDEETAAETLPGGAVSKEETSAPEPLVLVHHEPLERVIDDDAEESAGELLKDAMLQERIAGRIHEEERRTSLLEVEPTPEVTVGSWQHNLVSAAGFERISDDAHEPPTEAAPEPSAEAPAAAAAPSAEWQLEDLPAYLVETTAAPVAAWEELERQSVDAEQVVVEVAKEPAETGESAEVLPFNLPTPEFAAALETADPEETTEEQAAVEAAAEEVTPEEPLKDSSARVRQRPRRGEMATRRGGRGRRRTTPPYRQRTGASDATTDVEDEEGDEEETNGSAPAPLAPRAADRFRRPVITDLLREGQEVLVQIAKEPIGQKGARITSHVALPGRYIVYMPTVEHIGVSRKIGTDEERQRLKRTLHQLRAEAGASGGFIVRTAASGCTLEELREDMQYLIRTWTDIRRRSERAKAPAIVHRDLDLVQRILRDQLSSDFSAIRVDNEFEYERIVDFVNRFAPKLVNRVKLYTKDTPILEHYGVQQEIDKAVKPRVWLKSGGYIVINQTEALVAIDVNTGKFVGKSNRLEDTIVKTNIEAAKEIVRQIRLRDLGGIIVLDLIDMEERRNRAKVMAVLEQELRNDRSPSKVLQFNDFGLVAVTRKRVKQSLERTLCTPCSYCGGAGMVKSAQTLSYEILAEARRISKEIDHHTEVILRVNPEVAKALRTSERDVLSEIEAYLGGVVSIKSDPTVHQEQFDIALA